MNNTYRHNQQNKNSSLERQPAGAKYYGRMDTYEDRKVP